MPTSLTPSSTRVRCKCQVLRREPTHRSGLDVPSDSLGYGSCVDSPLVASRVEQDLFDLVAVGGGHAGLRVTGSASTSVRGDDGWTSNFKRRIDSTASPDVDVVSGGGIAYRYLSAAGAYDAPDEAANWLQDDSPSGWIETQPDGIKYITTTPPVTSLSWPTTWAKCGR